ncbi:MAG: family 78 glycoside hydrolase catalytic domain [Parasporobacterium sp.]|nr:family 78 glycoside hydrolase catalytic domain [Parasporobacterium sp.]
MKKKPVVIKIDINNMLRPVGIDDPNPVFHIWVDTVGKNKSLSGCEVLVGCKSQTIWDSGYIEGQTYVKYEGVKLLPKHTYQVYAKVWDECGIESEWSDVYEFETGFMGESWEADWIEPLQEPAYKEPELGFAGMLNPDDSFFNGETRLREAKQLRRKFNISMPVRARLFASAHGVYDIKINGRRISDARLAPETTDYNKMIWYQTYDVLSFLKDGDNVLEVQLADGWWIGRLGMAGDSCNYGDKLGFIMQLEFVNPDFSITKILSDEEFESRSSRIRYSDLYIGEKYDRTLEDEEWTGCRKADYPKDVLTGQPIDYVRVIDEIPVKKIFTTPGGELVMDFGQVVSGVVSMEIAASEGTEVILDHSEVLDADGNFMKNILGRNKNQQDILICSEGRQAFEPLFTYHGFRYVRVTNLAEPQIISAKALVIGTPLQKTGSFITDNEDINKLQHCIEWSTIGNMLSVPTDCPQREKLGWTGDINIYAETGCFLYGLGNFLGGWLAQMRKDQYDNGEIPVVVPNHPSQERLQTGMSGNNSSAVWGDACINVPLTLYRMYGNKEVLEVNYEMMQKWMDYIAAQCAAEPEGYENFTDAQKGRNPYLWTKGFHFGDWLVPSLRELPDGVMQGVIKTAGIIAACAYVNNIKNMIIITSVLGKKEENLRYYGLLNHVRQAVADEFVKPDGTVGDGTLQGQYVAVLNSGILSADLKEKAAAKLVELLTENDFCLDTGFSTVSYLLDVLYDNGYKDIAHKVLFNKKAPSWLYMVDKGATTIWENWKAVREDGTVTDSSFNHYAFGCVGSWMYRRIGGIYSLTAGYRKIKIDPDYSCGLNKCKTEYDSPYGKIVCDWRKEGRDVSLTVCIPAVVEAEVVLGDKTVNVGSGYYNWTVRL